MIRVLAADVCASRANLGASQRCSGWRRCRLTARRLSKDTQVGLTATLAQECGRLLVSLRGTVKKPGPLNPLLSTQPG